MTDVFCSAKRSEIMSRIKSRDNAATERRLIKIFREEGITGWRRNYPVFGQPDFVFPRDRVVVFVDGEFWHGHPVRGKIPLTNREFWQKKISKNKRRDRFVNQALKTTRWIVVRIWQRDLRPTRKNRIIRRLRMLLATSRSPNRIK